MCSFSDEATKLIAWEKAHQRLAEIQLWCNMEDDSKAHFLQCFQKAGIKHAHTAEELSQMVWMSVGDEALEHIRKRADGSLEVLGVRAIEDQVQ
jgi:hypothetical protein